MLGSLEGTLLVEGGSAQCGVGICGLVTSVARVVNWKEPQATHLPTTRGHSLTLLETQAGECVSCSVLRTKPQDVTGLT